jgi:hypothetical protein
MDTQETEEVEIVSVRKLNKFIKRLNITDKSVVVIKQGTDMAQHGNLNALAQTVGDAGFEGVVVVIAEELDDIKVLNEKAMNEHGWVKTSSVIAKLFDEEKENEPEEDDIV